MTKYRVAVVLEADNALHAIEQILYSGPNGETVENVHQVEAEEWD